MSRKALGRGLSALFNQTGAATESELVELTVDQLDPTPYQPRQYFDDARLEELAASIRSNGILQPIVVRRQGERFEIIAGERRWRAAQKAGIVRVPCVIKDVPDGKVLELSLIENIQREELNPIEEASAYHRLIEQLNVTQEEIAQRVGKDRSSIANSLRLLKLPEAIQRLVEDAKLSMGHARALLGLESAELQQAAAQEVLNKGLSVRATEELVKQVRDGGTTSRRGVAAALQSENANIVAAESKLSKRLDAPVKIKLSQAGGTIEIKFSSSEDLMRIFDALMRANPN